MTPTNERLGFLVRFLATDLSRLRPPAWARLKKDLQTFLATDPGRIQEKAAVRWGIVARSPLPAKQDELTEKVILDLQKAAKTLVTFVSKKEDGVRATPPVTITATYSLWCPGRGRFLYAEGSPQEMFLLVLHLLLIRGSDTQLRVCPECPKVFLRVRKQMYCGSRCKKRANMRAWRQTPQGKTSRFRESATRYEKKIDSVLPGAKITHHKRRSPL